MGFNKWITKKGITGKIAREVGDWYCARQRANPHMAPMQIADMLIIKNSPGGDRRMDCTVSLLRLVDALVDQAQAGGLIGRKSLEIRMIEREVIKEELQKKGVPDEVI